jgi:hypothetical protein
MPRGYTSKTKVQLIKTFWSHVNKNGPIPKHRPSLGRCWLWTGAIARTYPKFRAGLKNVGAHRFAYELKNGKIPEGKQLDHLCRVRHCVRPTHTEPVTHRINQLRGNTLGARNLAKKNCPYGHPLTKVKGQNRRHCITCRRKEWRRYYYNHREAILKQIKERKHEHRS